MGYERKFLRPKTGDKSGMAPNSNEKTAFHEKNAIFHGGLKPMIAGQAAI
jgi:hypothetical protein